MAYMNQEKKAKIAAALKLVVPKDWKYSLAVRHHSTIVLTVSEAPVDLIGAFHNPASGRSKPVEYGINPYYWHEQLRNEDVRETFTQIMTALNDGNHDRSDHQTDYCDVGWYVDVGFGRYAKPFKFTGSAA
jgi:hypothetical protein